jgi:hypothetical protein
MASHRRYHGQRRLSHTALALVFWSILIGSAAAVAALIP